MVGLRYPFRKFSSSLSLSMFIFVRVYLSETSEGIISYFLCYLIFIRIQVTFRRIINEM